MYPFVLYIFTEREDSKIKFKNQTFLKRGYMNEDGQALLAGGILGCFAVVCILLSTVIPCPKELPPTPLKQMADYAEATIVDIEHYLVQYEAGVISSAEIRFYLKDKKSLIRMKYLGLVLK